MMYPIQKCKWSVALKVFGLVGLLACYLLADLHSSLHHLLDHHDGDHSHNHCDQLIEADPCHQLVFHQNTEQGCSHKSHVYSKEDGCELCKAILIQDKTEIDFQVSFDNPEKHPGYLKTSQQRVIRYTVQMQTVRGPPVTYRSIEHIV